MKKNNNKPWHDRINIAFLPFILIAISFVISISIYHLLVWIGVNVTPTISFGIGVIVSGLVGCFILYKS